MPLATQFLTQEQADKVKAVIDNDANLASAYLEVKGLSYSSWYNDIWLKRDDFQVASIEDQENAWFSYVNDRLLPEDIIGACVVGGLFLAVLATKPEKRMFLPELFKANAASVRRIKNEVNGFVELLSEEYGLTYEMLSTLQLVNDGEKYVTENRRLLLKEQVDKFVTVGLETWVD